VKAVLSILAILIVSPALAEATIVWLRPDFTGERAGFLSFIGFVLGSLPFVYVTVPLWPTYMAAIILTPIIMRRVATHPTFRAASLPTILGLALLMGAAVGPFVVAFPIMLAARDSWSTAVSWVAAGAFSGGITLALITLFYRYE